MSIQATHFPSSRTFLIKVSCLSLKARPPRSASNSSAASRTMFLGIAAWYLSGFSWMRKFFRWSSFLTCENMSLTVPQASLHPAKLQVYIGLSFEWGCLGQNSVTKINKNEFLDLRFKMTKLYFLYQLFIVAGPWW